MNYTIPKIKDILSDKDEKYILKILNKKPPVCYAKLSSNEIKNLENKIINNQEFKEYNNILEQIKSIRSSYIKNKMIFNHQSLLKNTNKIIKDYNNKVNILEISKNYDGSPLNIMRVILLKTNSKERIKKFFNNPSLLNDYDYEQFNLAKENDDFALINQDEILKKATEFEKQIEEIIIKNNILYKTQEDLTQEQIKTHGKAFSTPDFLIESELKINNRNIKWIDAKNFYGSNIKFVKSKIEEQTKKYLNNYGDGCIIFKLGFNEIYSENKNILFLSWNSFKELHQ
jgi:hypothetical protein